MGLFQCNGNLSFGAQFDRVSKHSFFVGFGNFAYAIGFILSFICACDMYPYQFSCHALHSVFCFSFCLI